MPIKDILDNLDHLQTLLPTTPWCLSSVEEEDDYGIFWDDEFGERLGGFERKEQAMFVVALRNAYPLLRAEIRRLMEGLDTPSDSSTA